MQPFTLRSAFRFATDKQKFMFLFGAPGVGKGTYAKILSKDLQYNHISTGDQIRKILKGNAPSTFDKTLTQKIKDIVNSGGLVDDNIVVGIIKEKLKEPQSQKGVILDGFPRTKGQLNRYDELLPTHLVVNLTLRDDILMEKLMGRRSCPKCGGSYNICDIQRDGYSMDPLLPKKGACDGCSDVNKLQMRDDDKKEIIEVRMKEYAEKTEPLLKEFQKKGVLMNFEVKKGVKDYPELKRQITQKLAKVK